MLYVSRSILILLGVLLASPAKANDLPLNFTYQGRLTDAAGMTSYTGVVGFKLTILDPSGTCILYQELQSSVDLGTTGLFSLRVGTATGHINRTANDPGLQMKTVFSNTAAAAIVPNSSNCSLGAGYTPATGEYRLLKVGIVRSGSETVLTPDLVINSAPMATVAQTIEGVGLSGLIQSTATITTANLTTLTDGSDGSSLHHHDTLYARNGGTSFGIGDTTPDADFEIEKASPTLRLTGTANAGNAMRIDFYGGAAGATNTASIRGADNANTLTFYTGSTQAMQLDSSQNALFSGSISTAGTMGLGKYTNAQETTLATALGILGTSATGTLWANTTSNVLKYWDGAAVQTIGTAGATGDFLKDGSVAMTGDLNLGGMNVDGLALGAVGSPSLAFTADTNTGIYSAGADDVSVAAGGTQIASFTSSGVTVGSGVLLNTAGTAAAPSVTFTSDSNTGMYSVGADNLGFSTGGTLRLDLGASGVDVNSQKIINVTDPGAAQDAATKAYVDTSVGTGVLKAGDTMTGNLTIGNGATTAGTLILKEDTDDGTDTVSVKAAAMAAPYTLTLPVDDGTANQVLTSDGSGVLSWSSVSGTYLPIAGGTMTGALNMGGQTFYGNTTSGGSLTLGSTSHATRGKIYLGSGSVSAYDEVNNRLGLGTTSPTHRLHVPWLSGDAVATTSIGSTNASNNQIAVLGYSYSNIGIYGESTSAQGIEGVSSSNYGVHGKSTTGVGVYGESTNSSYAVFAETWGTSGGVLAVSTGGMSGLFQTRSSDGSNANSTLVTRQNTSQTADLFQAQNTASTAVMKVSVSGDITVNAQADVRFADADSSNYVAIQSPTTVSSNVTYTLPSSDGAAGATLSTNGSGTLSWKQSLIKYNTAGASITNDDVPSNDTDLQFAVSANTTYAVEGLLIFAVGSATPDLQIAIDIPTAGFVKVAMVSNKSTTTTSEADILVTDNSPVAFNLASGFYYTVKLSGTIRSTTAGTAYLKWAQNVSDPATLTMYAGSYMSLTQTDN